MEHSSSAVRPWKVVAPFVALALLGLAVAALPPRPTSWALVIAAAVVTAVLVAVGLTVPWSTLPSWTHPIVPLGYFIVIALLRDAQGGAGSGYAPLCMLPIFWLALYGTRRHLLVGVLCVAVLFVAPLLAWGGEDEYPVSEWRRAILWVAVAGTVGLWAQSLTTEVRRRGRRARAQAASLKVAEEALAASMSASPTGIATTDLEGRFLTVNPALTELLGRSVDELVGRHARDFSHPDDRIFTADAIASIAESQTSTHHEEKRYLRPDGDVVWCLLSISVVPDTEGRPLRLLCHFQDITAQKLAEQALKETEANLRAVGRVARELALTRDVRPAVCSAAIDVTAGSGAFVFEPDGRGSLVVTASLGSGGDVPPLSLRGTQPSGCVTAFLTATRIFATDARSDPRISSALADALDAGSVVFEPIVHRGEVVGVLVVFWHEQLALLLDERVAEALRLLATEAAVAFEREELYSRLEAHARLDGLTEVPNRRAWDEELDRLAAQPPADDQPVSVALLDLDHFKRFNDTNGHQAGDDLLRTVAQLWQAELRPGDLIARYGGEEFGVVLKGCDIGAAGLVLERLCSLVPEGQTCSAGVAQWDGRESPTTLVARADAALYRAKAAGRARVELAGPRIAAAPVLLDAS